MNIKILPIRRTESLKSLSVGNVFKYDNSLWIKLFMSKTALDDLKLEEVSQTLIPVANITTGIFKFLLSTTPVEEIEGTFIELYPEKVAINDDDDLNSYEILSKL